MSTHKSNLYKPADALEMVQAMIPWVETWPGLTANDADRARLVRVGAALHAVEEELLGFFAATEQPKAH